jgi:hypothetical protein
MKVRFNVNQYLIEIKRRRFKPTSSPSQLAHARNEALRNSPGGGKKGCTEELLRSKIPNDLRIGGTSAFQNNNEDDSRYSIESSLNFRPIRGVN